MIDPSWTVDVPGGRVRVRCSERDDGDFHLENVARAVLERRRRTLVDLPWTMLDERHGVEVVAVDRPGAGDRCVGDIAWTDVADAVLGVWAGDCAPVVLVAPSGRLGVAHAGWRGLASGVLAVAVRAVGDDHGSRGVTAWLGPRIGPCCYEFGDDDLAAVAAGTGVPADLLEGRTRWGRRALDVPTAVVDGLARLGVIAVDSGWCTGCDVRFHSHRRRADPGRHVVAAWKEVARS